MEIEIGFRSVDIEIHEVEVKGVRMNVAFWSRFHTCDVFLAIAAECNSNIYILLESPWTMLY